MKKTIYRSRPKTAKTAKTANESEASFRLNKYIAHCGICSRRDAAELIKKGEVFVNGKVETNPAYEVQKSDQINYQGKTLRIEEQKVYILMNKPKNVITTLHDDRGRRTVYDLIRNDVQERVFPVGRLDRNTTGLLLLTNDGDLAQKLSHPSHEMSKLYHVILDKPLTKRDKELIEKGLELEDGKAEVDSIDFAYEKKNEVGVAIHSGKNRIVRRIFEHLGYEVVRLDRVLLAGLTKKNLPRGRFRHLTEKEVIQLKHLKH